MFGYTQYKFPGFADPESALRIPAPTRYKSLLLYCNLGPSLTCEYGKFVVHVYIGESCEPENAEHPSEVESTIAHCSSHYKKSASIRALTTSAARSPSERISAQVGCVGGTCEPPQICQSQSCSSHPPLGKKHRTRWFSKDSW